MDRWNVWVVVGDGDRCKEHFVQYHTAIATKMSEFATEF